MKKKVIIVIIILILLVAVGIFAYFSLSKKEKEPELIYIKDVMAASSETKYLSATIEKVLDYLNNHEITQKTEFNKLNITLPEYEKCGGTITPKNGTYLVESNCGNSDKDGYTVNFALSSKKSNLKSLGGFISLENGNIYYGPSKEDKRINIGFLDNDMNIGWENAIPIKTNDVIISKVNVLSDGYLVVIANLKNDDIDNYDLVKIDKTGKIIKQETKDKTYRVYNTSKDTTLVKDSEDKIILLDKDLKTTKELSLVKPLVISVENNNIYYIDEDKNLHITNKEGKEKISFALDTTDEGYMQLEIINNKIFVLGDKSITIYDKNGNLLNTFTYDNLRVDKNIYNEEHNDNAIYDVRKVDDYIYVNVFLEVYNLLDYYDSNLEQVHRNIYEMPYAEIGSTTFSQNIVGGDIPYSLNYSEEYGRFVKMNYID